MTFLDKNMMFALELMGYSKDVGRILNYLDEVTWASTKELMTNLSMSQAQASRCLGVLRDKRWVKMRSKSIGRGKPLTYYAKNVDIETMKKSLLKAMEYDVDSYTHKMKMLEELIE